MRPIASFTLHALAAAALGASAGAAAAPPRVVSAEVFLKLPGAEGGGQIEVQSYQWGTANAVPADKKSKHFDEWAVEIEDSQSDDGEWIAEVERPQSAGGSAQKTLAFPNLLERGSLVVKGNFPNCTVGAAFPDALLESATARFELKDVVVAGCALDGVHLYYAKVTVRGWDPKKKEN